MQKANICRIMESNEIELVTGRCAVSYRNERKKILGDLSIIS